MHDISKDIVLQAARGDINAFEKIYTAMNSFVFNVAFRIAGNKEDAKEITQDVFIKMHRKLSSFMFRSSFKTWVYRITTNTAINAVNRVRKKADATISCDDDIKLKNQAVGSDLAITENSSCQTLERLLYGMDINQRACIVLRSIEGLSYKQISESLNVNINTVRTRIKRAREYMMKNLNKEAGSYEL
jgi:RNA polymerase sigma-70 factor, ECF subfamily